MNLGVDGRDELTVVVGFELGGWDVADSRVQPTLVEPVDPFEGREFDVIEPTPGPTRWPFSAARSAATLPPNPEPMITTS